jgi:hypothetical protein
MRKALRRTFVVAFLATASVAASASPAAGVTVGEVGPPEATCSSGDEYAQPSYVVPPIPPASALSITSWSHVAEPGPGQKLKLKLYRPVAGLTYTVVAQEVRNLTESVLNTFPTRIAVNPGDLLGITTAPDSADDTGCGIGAGGDTVYTSSGDAPTGAQVTFVSFSGFRLNVSAVVEPTNTFSFGQMTRNKKKGTATLTLAVPNPGALAVSGKGAKEAFAAGVGATAAKSVPAGTVKLKIKAKGKKLKKLNQTGKVKLNPSITYTPTSGSPSTQSTKLKLKKR